MIRGEKVALRTPQEADLQVFQAELYQDVRERSSSDSRPWRPLQPDAPDSPAAVAEPAPEKAYFSVVDLATRKLAGEALLWGIDQHNRSGHLGLSLLPAFRGQGLGTDVVRVLCEYGFAVRGLHRLQVETLARNTAMITAANRCGFVLEGTLRSAAWLYGAFVDEVILGLLAEDWTPQDGPAGICRTCHEIPEMRNNK